MTMHILFKVSQSLAQRLFYVTLEWAEPRKNMAVNHDKMRELYNGTLQIVMYCIN